MANLNNQNIGLNYKGILNLNTLNGDLLSNPSDKITDGMGNQIPIRVATTGVLFDGIVGFENSGIFGLFDYSALSTISKIWTLPNISGTFTFGTGTTNQLTYWVNTNTIGSLSTSTYPSLSELSHVKGVTSAVQTQLNARAATNLVGSPAEIQLACSDESTALTTGTKVTFRMPYAMTLQSVRASLTTAQASGSIFTVDIRQGGVSVLSTKITIDNTERTSTTAVTAPVISTSALTDDAEITISIDQIGTSGAAGLKVLLKGIRA